MMSRYLSFHNYPVNLEDGASQLVDHQSLWSAHLVLKAQRFRH